IAEWQNGRIAEVIALIDYKAGNLTSVRKAFAALGATLFTPEKADELAEAHAIVVPGVGHFGATRALGPDWIDAILARVGEGRPLLASASACSGCSRAARKRRICAVWACSAAAATGCRLL